MATLPVGELRDGHKKSIFGILGIKKPGVSRRSVAFGGPCSTFFFETSIIFRRFSRFSFPCIRVD